MKRARAPSLPQRAFIDDIAVLVFDPSLGMTVRVEFFDLAQSVFDGQANGVDNRAILVAALHVIGQFSHGLL